MTSHFESLTVHVQESDGAGGKRIPHESGKDQSHDSRARSGNTVGEVGAAGKPRESHFESLAGKVGDRDVGGDQKQRQREQDQPEKKQSKGGEAYGDRARSGNMVGDKEAEANRGREEHGHKTSGPYAVGKLDMRGSEQQRPSTEVKGRADHRQQEKGIIKLRGREEGRQQQEQGGQMRGQVEGRQQQQQGREMRGKVEGRQHQQVEQGREMRGKEEGRGKQQQPSLEEISKLRGTAQQRSIDALMAAEERYNQAKEDTSRKLGGVTEYAAEKGSQAKDTLLQGAQRTSQLAAEKGSRAKDYTVPKTEQAKNYALEKAAAAKDNAIDTSKKVASYTGEKAAAAKDVTVESGKGAASYAGNVAVDVKDKAVAAGWSSAHYTTEKAMEGPGVVAKVAQYTAEKAVEGTKASARAVEGAAEYAGHKAVEIASKPLGAAKEIAVATGESLKDFTARKKEEAERELEAKRAQRGQDTEWSYQGGAETEQSFQGGDDKGENQSLTRKAEDKVKEFARSVASTVQQTVGGVTEQGRQEKGFTEPQGGDNRGGQQSLTRKAEEKVKGVAEQGKHEKGFSEQLGYENQGGGGGGAAAEVLSAIGETVVEIAQTTKDFIVGERSIGEKIVGHDDQPSQAEYGRPGETRREQRN